MTSVQDVLFCKEQTFWEKMILEKRELKNSIPLLEFYIIDKTKEWTIPLSCVN